MSGGRERPRALGTVGTSVKSSTAQRLPGLSRALGTPPDIMQDSFDTMHAGFDISPHWPSLEGLKEAGAYVLMVCGVVAVFWSLW